MNFLEKSRVQQLTHGLPYKPRNKQPSMFEILAWTSQNQNNQKNLPLKNQNNKNQNGVQNIEFTGQKGKQNCQNCVHHQHQKLNWTKSSRKIKHEIYSYDDQEAKARKIVQEATKNIIRQQMSPSDKRVKFSERQKCKSLNPSNSVDALQIQKRKKKIKNFKMLSRQLPDSAFTTYFGKPAFANYGIGSTSQHKKSFNIMPHAGKNHPEYQQSYETALKRGREIQPPNYIPKKPIEIYHPADQNSRQSDYYEIPIKKPNLINNVRFSQDKSYLQRKAPTPKHNELNPVRSRESLHSNLKASKHSEKGKLKKVKSLKSFETLKSQYPLVNNRDNLREILEERKREENKLAYKVTECYPLPFNNCDKNCQTKHSRWSQMRPAGITSPRSDHATDVFNPNTLWR